jgi:hypothetical protein
MNFYTLISKSSTSKKVWVKLLIISTIVVATFIFLLNYIVDPYNITNYNLLNIKSKFARDDRIEKVTFFKTLDKFDNIILGSSRVYSMNPDIVSNHLGGTTYNFAVGGASVEDNLGVLLYLQREKKLPKNIILGADFYTFNPNVPPNKYFLKNKELNFLVYENFQSDSISKFFSIDACRASFTTLKNHIKNKEKKSHFKSNGWLNNDGYENYNQIDLEKNFIETQNEIINNIKIYFTNFSYAYLDTKRIDYYERIRQICLDNKINLYVFTTPLHPLLLNKLQENENTQKALDEFVNYLNTFPHFYNTLYDENFYNNLKHFKGSTHTTLYAGDIIINNIFNYKEKLKVLQ